jgi:superfamily I DNA/RNA helicase
MEEERRLFYVAITRAADNLWILCPCACKGVHVEPSPYIHECGLEFNNFYQKA